MGVLPAHAGQASSNQTELGAQQGRPGRSASPGLGAHPGARLRGWVAGMGQGREPVKEGFERGCCSAVSGTPCLALPHLPLHLVHPVSTVLSSPCPVYFIMSVSAKRSLSLSLPLSLHLSPKLAFLQNKP